MRCLQREHTSDTSVLFLALLLENVNNVYFSMCITIYIHFVLSPGNRGFSEATHLDKEEKAAEQVEKATAPIRVIIHDTFSRPGRTFFISDKSLRNVGLNGTQMG